MAEARFALGAVVDIASGAEVNEGFKALRGDLGAMGKPKRIMRPISRAVTLGALASGDTTVLNIGRPSTGRVWVVTRVVVLANDDHTALTNATAALYVGDPENVSLGQCVRSGTAIPFTTTENEHAYVVHDREDFIVQISASGVVTAGTNIVVNILAWDYRDYDIDAQAI